MNEDQRSRQQPEALVVITEEKLRIHQRYKGKNYGYWERGMATPDEYATLSDKEFSAIDELLQLLYLSKTGTAAESWKTEIEQRLAQQAVTPEVAALLWEFAV